MPSTGDTSGPIFFDTSLPITALCERDARYAEAAPLVEAAREGSLDACIDASVLSEVYGALTWERTLDRVRPAEALRSIRLPLEPPAAIRILDSGFAAALKALELAAAHGLTARRVHDARHAAVALLNGIRSVHTYDASDWQAFESDGLTIAGPPSVLQLLGRLP